MDEIIKQVKEFSITAYQWFDQVFLSVNSVVQLGIIVIIFFIALPISRYIISGFSNLLNEKTWYEKVSTYLEAIILPVFMMVVLMMVISGAESNGSPVHMFRMAGSLIFIWMVVRLIPLFITNSAIARVIKFVAWGVAILNIFDWLEPVERILDNIQIPLGSNPVSLLGMLMGVITLVALVYLGLVLARLFENLLRSSPDVSASARVLLSKLARIAFVAFAFLFAVSSMGVDLTVFAVFGGAIGVGLGFGLQKVVSNFISGIILLLDQSIKPGDVIEVSGSYGRINKLAARYTSVISRDGREHLVPNEDMITQPVVNWTMSNKKVRRHLPVGVSYNSDLELAMSLMTEAAAGEARVLKKPAPVVLIKGFGDNSVDLELRMWISDSEKGVSNVASHVYLAIWNKFNEAGVDFPYPQRDLHIVSAQGLKDLSIFNPDQPNSKAVKDPKKNSSKKAALKN
jgi:small-conductance mechanosensitive channel